MDIFDTSLQKVIIEYVPKSSVFRVVGAGAGQFILMNNADHEKSLEQLGITEQGEVELSPIGHLTGTGFFINGLNGDFLIELTAKHLSESSVSFVRVERKDE